MRKIIVIDLDGKYEYVNKYDDNKINDGLHKYLLDSFDDLKKDIVLSINFNYDISPDEINNIEQLFKSSFSEKLTNTVVELNNLRVKEIVLMLLGFLFLIIYCFLDKYSIFLFSEFFLVISWVVFWEMFEGWLFSRKKLKIVKLKYQKLLLADIEINV